MNLYFDTEFTGLHAGTTLVSIGIVAENGKKFYAEFSDYDERQCNDWIKENVLKHTILEGDEILAKRLGEDSETTVVLGSKADIRYELGEWLKQFDSVQFVSDVCHYDMVLLIDILAARLICQRMCRQYAMTSIRTLQGIMEFPKEKHLTRAGRKLFPNFAANLLHATSTMRFMTQKLSRRFIEK